MKNASFFLAGALAIAFAATTVTACDGEENCHEDGCGEGGHHEGGGGAGGHHEGGSGGAGGHHEGGAGGAGGGN